MSFLTTTARLWWVLVASSGLLTRTVLAIQASPMPFDVQQPDGSIASIFVRGNEMYNYLETAEGYTVVQTEVLCSSSYICTYTRGQRNRCVEAGTRA